jgi:hypothetical protein
MLGFHPLVLQCGQDIISFVTCCFIGSIILKTLLINNHIKLNLNLWHLKPTK